MSVEEVGDVKMSLMEVVGGDLTRPGRRLGSIGHTNGVASSRVNDAWLRRLCRRSGVVRYVTSTDHRPVIGIQHLKL